MSHSIQFASVHNNNNKIKPCGSLERKPMTAPNLVYDDSLVKNSFLTERDPQQILAKGGLPSALSD